ncbi:hypothetical protein AB0K51_08130 [Kitasatospora sp. NPDC049285]|uniref:hypothetical protein n=1 Tax=Kitasatospora sp. NPDC049285 TaxID=3157096 RepID=UPI003413CAAB
MEYGTAQFWSGVVAVLAALAVIAGYLIGGARLVWVISAFEVAAVMGWVAYRFRGRAHQRVAGAGPDAAHCERCRRARERLDAKVQPVR